MLISVSRLSNEKNIDFLIDAIAGLRQRIDQPFQLLLIGDGHQRERLQRRIDALSLGQWFRLLGAVPPEQMALYYRLGDLFVFASKTETQGMVILEAMAAGLPVVAVRSSGIDDVVRQGYNGFKTPEDGVRWGDQVARLLADDALREEMAEHALSVAREHSIEQFAGGVKEIYATVLAAYQAPNRVRGVERALQAAFAAQAAQHPAAVAPGQQRPESGQAEQPGQRTQYRGARHQQDIGVEFAMDAALVVLHVKFGERAVGVDAGGAQLFFAAGDVQPFDGVVARIELFVAPPVGHAARAGTVVKDPELGHGIGPVTRLTRSVEQGVRPSPGGAPVRQISSAHRSYSSASTMRTRTLSPGLTAVLAMNTLPSISGASA